MPRVVVDEFWLWRCSLARSEAMTEAKGGPGTVSLFRSTLAYRGVFFGDLAPKPIYNLLLVSRFNIISYTISGFGLGLPSSFMSGIRTVELSGAGRTSFQPTLVEEPVPWTSSFLCLGSADFFFNSLIDYLI